MASDYDNINSIAEQAMTKNKAYFSRLTTLKKNNKC